MKQKLLLLFCLSYLGLFAQPIDSSGVEKTHQFAVVERIPIALGCYSLRDSSNEDLKTCFQEYILKHVAENFNFPKSANKEKVYAKIYVNFIIEKNGAVSGVEVVRGALDEYKGKKRKKRKAAIELDEEAKRVVSSLYFLEPAIQREKPVRMSFTLPINAIAR